MTFYAIKMVLVRVIWLLMQYFPCGFWGHITWAQESLIRAVTHVVLEPSPTRLETVSIPRQPKLVGVSRISLVMRLPAVSPPGINHLAPIISNPSTILLPPYTYPSTTPAAPPNVLL